MQLSTVQGMQPVRFGAGPTMGKVKKAQEDLIKAMPPYPAWNGIGITRVNKQLGLHVTSPSDKAKSDLAWGLVKSNVITPLNEVSKDHGNAPVYLYKGVKLVFENIGEIKAQ